MGITNIGHVAYQVKDLNKSLDFYCNILGFKTKCSLYNHNRIKMLEEGKDHRTPEQRKALIQKLQPIQDDVWLTYLEIADTNQFLELFPYYEGVSPEDIGKGSHYLHLSLEVDDMEATLQEFKLKGLDIKGSYGVGVDNSLVYWLSDPDDNPIELMQYTEYSMQKLGNKFHELTK